MRPTDHLSPSTNHKDFLGAIVAGLIIVATCLLLLWRDPLLFWNDDYEISILPVFADVARSWSEGHWPLLSPYSWVCSNLAGEFQYGTFSIFVNAVVVLIWKFPLTFPQQAAALSIAHLFVLGMGGYVVARGRVSSSLSMMVALVTALNGWIICWGATDWFGALGAFTWLPWAWWGMERALDSRRSCWRFLWPAPFVYLLVTGGFPYIVLMLAVLSVWLILKVAVTGHSTDDLLGQDRSTLWPLILGLVLGLGLSSPAWLALLDYVRGSARAVQDSSAHFQWVVPVTALPGFILPNWTVEWTNFYTRLAPHPATEMACGLVTPIALAAGLVLCGRTFVRQIKWEIGLLVAVLILSMLPSVSVFRWSFRWLPFLHLILALCAANALRLIADKADDSPSTRSIVFRPSLFGILLVGLATVASFMFNTSGDNAFPFVWISLGIAAGWAILERTNRRNWLAPVITLASLIATYICLPTNVGVPKFNLSQKLTEPAPLDRERLYLSVYPAPEFSYHTEKKANPFGTTLRIGSTSMWGGIQLLNGYSPIRPAGVAREFDFAVHGEIGPDTGNWLLEHEAGSEGKLARLGVDGIIVATELDWEPKPATEWELAVTTEEGRVYHRRGGPLPRIRSVNALDSRPGEQFSTAKISKIMNERNRLIADVTASPEGPALLSISRPYFDGYRAKIGGVPVRVNSYRGLIPTVEIPAGMSGQLVLTYRPLWLSMGGAISLICLLVMIVSVISALNRKKNAKILQPANDAN